MDTFTVTTIGQTEALDLLYASDYRKALESIYKSLGPYADPDGGITERRIEEIRNMVPPSIRLKK